MSKIQVWYFVRKLSAIEAARVGAPVEIQFLNDQGKAVGTAHTAARHSLVQLELTSLLGCDFPAEKIVVPEVVLEKAFELVPGQGSYVDGAGNVLDHLGNRAP